MLKLKFNYKGQDYSVNITKEQLYNDLSLNGKSFVGKFTTINDTPIYCNIMWNTNKIRIYNSSLGIEDTVSKWGIVNEKEPISDERLIQLWNEFCINRNDKRNQIFSTTTLSNDNCELQQSKLYSIIVDNTIKFSNAKDAIMIKLMTPLAIGEDFIGYVNYKTK